ncbi:hypothetical protein [Indioceanicola profundi]|uniref:hypothetical protein n=1 Tax=Indioceanicola profundi TaxID=2220096 RepID=UPI0013C4D30A|nr:hypothetical protein [Indioceanicola profundi]
MVYATVTVVAVSGSQDPKGRNVQVLAGGGLKLKPDRFNLERIADSNLIFTGVGRRHHPYAKHQEGKQHLHQLPEPALHGPDLCGILAFRTDLLPIGSASKTILDTMSRFPGLPANHFGDYFLFRRMLTINALPSDLNQGGTVQANSSCPHVGSARPG